VAPFAWNRRFESISLQRRVINEPGCDPVCVRSPLSGGASGAVADLMGLGFDMIPKVVGKHTDRSGCRLGGLAERLDQE
jgi:hypothetical protein